jgi:alpha-mannosidase
MDHERRFTRAKLARRLALITDQIQRQSTPLGTLRYKAYATPEATPDVGVDVDDQDWPRVEPNTYWGEWNTTFTLRGHFAVPEAWSEAEPLALALDLGNVEQWDFCHPEALVYVDGLPLAGCDKFHRSVTLPPACCDGRQHLLALHGYTGRWGHFEPPPPTRLFIGTCRLVQIDSATRDLVAMARVALDALQVLDGNSPARARILTALDRAFAQLDTREPLGADFYATVPDAHHTLRDGLHAAGPALDVEITAIGHTHIDVAWLWPLAQTRLKCGRSFHTVLTLMDQFDDYTFTQSQPQLYDYVRKDYPDLFARIQTQVVQGRWEVTGGMWVEADCNLSGPESLVRQLLLGRRFFAEHFGPDAETPIAWLPDVFGFPHSLPQLLKQAGLDYFFTTKLSWNQSNRMPYDSFWWQGLDGTKVLAHLGTTSQAGSDKGMPVTYNGTATAEEIYKTWTNFQQKPLQHDLMTVFGYGDGGGGPTREMLENLSEMADFPGLPRTRPGRAIDFFRKMDETAGPQLPTWNGELYLEYHRGTYTTQARNKKANRKNEFLLHDAEWLNTLAAQVDPQFPYPHVPLREVWQLLCLNQFHDILPGSSIGEVYHESLEQYDVIERMAGDLRDAALTALANAVGGNLIVANPTPFEQTALALWPGQLPPGQSLRHRDGRAITTQSIPTGTLIDLGPVPAYAIVPLVFASAPPPAAAPPALLQATTERLENDQLCVTLNAAGDITRIYDKTHGRDVLSDAAVANQLQAFEDRPIDWDAWDIDPFYDDTMWTAQGAKSVRVVESGPLRAMIEIERQILDSHYTQHIALDYHSRRLDVATQIDWQQKHVLLKTAFPVAIHANEATYEIQWGNVQRPTHRNTSWDGAKFEACAQKWIDLSEGDYGVSLLNDCKYGHDVKDNVLRMTLLRSPTMPDPEADQGTHQFAYSLLPHAGRWGRETLAAAYALNDPLIVHAARGGQGQAELLPPLVHVDRENVVVETIKRAEDDRGIVVRMYEALRQRGPVTLTAGFELHEAYTTNLLEQDDERLPVDGRCVKLHLRPHQIATLRLVPASRRVGQAETEDQRSKHDDTSASFGRGVKFTERRPTNA